MDTKDNRKKLAQEYKNRKVIGGVYRIVNIQNGRYLLDCAPELRSRQNAFDFMVSSGVCFDYKLKQDWSSFGSQAFVFEILETVEKKAGQSQEEYIDNLLLLEQIWNEKLGPASRY